MKKNLPVRYVYTSILIAFILISVSTIGKAQCNFLNENFDTPPVLAATNTDGTWYPDRYPPAGFTSAAFGGGNVLKISIDGTADGAANRGGLSANFYNTQGRKFNQCNKCVTVLKGDLYIPADWETNHRRSDMWATAFDAANLISFYPIIGFRNPDGASPNLYYWDGAASIDLGAPANYDTWYSLEARLVGVNLEYLINNVIVATVPSNGSTYYGNIIMQAFNFNNAAIAAPYTQSADSYDAYWDNLITTGTGGNVVTNINTGQTFCTIQAAIDDINTTAGHTIVASAGTYNEDVNVNKSVIITGAGAVLTTIRGVIGGASASTVAVGANNVAISGFTITRDGNNTTDWNNPSLNSAGFSVQGIAIVGMHIHDNIISGNRTGIDINNSNGHFIHNNIITNNRTGLIFRNQTDNLTFQENEVTDNWTVGILFLDASGGTNSPLQTALNCTFFNNNISGNWYGQIVDRQTGGSLPVPGTTNLKNFSGNWYGTITPVVTTANSAEPGYAAQIPVVFGGVATAPGGQPDIAGSASANFDFTPYLNNGTDVNVEATPGWGTFGFQGNFSSLWVTAASVQSGGIARIQEGINTISVSTINVTAGTYNENVLVNKSVDIIGAGIGSTILTPLVACTGDGMNITASNVNVSYLTITNYSYGIKTSAATISLYYVESNLNCLYGLNTTSGTNGLNILKCKFNSNTVGGWRAGTADVVTNVTVDSTEMKTNGVGVNNGFGTFIAATTSATNVFDNITIKNSDFSNNLKKGMYFEKLNHALIDNVIVNNSGIDPAYGFNNGIDVNLKYDTYTDIVIQNSSITNSGIMGTATDVRNPAAVTIKARDDSPSYISDPATLTGFVFKNNFVSGPENGLRFGEFGKANAGPAGNTVYENHFGNAYSNKAVLNETAAPLTAECNWFGTIVESEIGALVSGTVDYSPYLLNGTDNSIDPGFQPVPNTCGTADDYDGDGIPNANDCDPLDPAVGAKPQLNTSINGVMVNSVNDGADDVASFSVCNTANNILFDYFLDANGLAGPLVKAYQVIENTNVTVPFCNNCSATLTAFAGASGTAALINPNISGTLVIKFREFVDTDNDGQLGDGECAGDWVIYTVTVNPSPVCSISGFDVNCPGSGSDYTGAPDMSSYKWSISGNGSISGSTTDQTVTVIAGSECNSSYTLSLTVTNSNDCSASCTKIVTVIDDTKPEITLTPAATLGCNPTASQIAAAFGSASVLDNCSSGLVATGVVQPETGSGCYFSTKKTWTVTDACGNTQTAEQTVSYKKDNQKPVINKCPSNIYTCNTTVSWTAPTASDNCGVKSFNSNFNSGSIFPVGTTTVTYTARDHCGNTTNCSFTVTVKVQPNAGSLSCTPNICVGATTTITSNGTAGGSWISLHPAVATVDATSGLIKGISTGTATIKYTVSNSCGTKYATRSITVVNGTVSISCPSGSPFTRYAGTSCKYTILSNEFKPTAASNCGTVALSYSLSGATSATGTSLSGVQLNKGTTTVTWKATSGSLYKTCSITIYVKDNKAPSITCKPGTTRNIPASNSCYTVSATEFNATTSDNCGTPSLIYCLSGATVASYSGSNTSLAGKLLNVGTTTITWKATDGSGNVSTCTTVVKVIKGSYASRSSNSENVYDQVVPGTLKVKVMPNPSGSHFTLLISSQSNDKVNVRIVDFMGRIIEVKPNIIPNGTVVVGSSFLPGTYIAEVIQGKEKAVLKLIKINK